MHITIAAGELGYRGVSRQEPTTANTVFPIASLTKSFAGACINRLRVQGELSLIDLIWKHLPEIKSRGDAVATTATIADLLGHRTGLQKASDLWEGADGELLIDQRQITAFFNRLRPRPSLRSQFPCNNLCYAVLGEIITKLTGQPYHSYVKENILDTLDMTRTTLTKHSILQDVSLTYSALDSAEPYNVPLPSYSLSSAMGPAGGMMSTVNDLLKYHRELMRSWPDQKDSKSQAHGSKSLFGDVSWLFTPLQIMAMPLIREKNYAAGWARSQLPNAVGDLGYNSGLVDEMPELADGTQSRLALWHQGSLVGATSFVMLFPETQSGVLVLTNTMAINDAADWIGQLLVETLLASPIRNDFVHLAAASANCALEKYANFTQMIEQGRDPEGPKRPLSDYVGSYVGLEGIYQIQIAQSKGGLDLLFQGRKSQKYDLKYHHNDTFTWFMTWNEQIKRARFLIYQPDLYFIHFRSEQGEKIDSLVWVLDSAFAEGEKFTREQS